VEVLPIELSQFSLYIIIMLQKLVQLQRRNIVIFSHNRCKRSGHALSSTLSGKRPSLMTMIVALLYIVLWSSAFIATKIGIKYCPPLALLSIRFIVAALILVFFIVLWRLPLPRGRRVWGRLIIFSLLNSCLYLGCTFEALKYLSAGMTSIIAATNPLLLALLAPILLQEAMTWRRVLGLVLGFGGVLFVMWTRLGGGNGYDTPSGILLASIGILSLVSATVLYKKYPPQEHMIVVNAVQFGISEIVLLPISAIFENVGHISWNGALIWSLLYLVCMISIGAMLLWFWLLKRGEASVVSSYYFLTPICGLLLAALVLGEPFGFRDGVGLIAAAIGIFLINSSAKLQNDNRWHFLIPKQPSSGQEGTLE
jgi:drug/metabolite transporter (DMT)-like permease